MIRHREFDVCEFSLAQYLVAKSMGEPLVAIPVFPHRRFRHSYVFVNAEAGIEKPKDLEGKRVGIRQFGNTAGLWMRGILHHYYGVNIKGIEWVTQDEEALPLQLGDKVQVSRVSSGETIDALLVTGAIEAAIYPDNLPSFLRGDTAVRRLFADPKTEEIQYYQDTGIFPIMHTVVIKQETIDQFPWVARSLFDAFQKAKEICYRRVEDPRKATLAWVMHLLEEQKGILGEDPWAYGLDGNRKNVETLVQYAHGEGLISRKLELEELFFESSLDQPPQYL
jgi:4,5-dihydroxyphthalate decarboxylase